MLLKDLYIMFDKNETIDEKINLSMDNENLNFDIYNPPLLVENKSILYKYSSNGDAEFCKTSDENLNALINKIESTSTNEHFIARETGNKRLVEEFNEFHKINLAKVKGIMDNYDIVVYFLV